jgi:hypothetical protein
LSLRYMTDTEHSAFSHSGTCWPTLFSQGDQHHSQLPVPRLYSISRFHSHCSVMTP